MFNIDVKLTFSLKFIDFENAGAKKSDLRYFFMRKLFLSIKKKFFKALALNELFYMLLKYIFGILFFTLMSHAEKIG